MRRIGPLVLAVWLLLGFVGKALAWDATGHEQIADIAWVRLKPKTRAAIYKILLAGDPQFRPDSPRERDVRLAFRKAAVFADVIKSDFHTSYEPEVVRMNDLFPLTHDPNDREDVRCKTWHYYDTPVLVPTSEQQPHPPRDSNALRALTRAQEQFALLNAQHSDLRLQCWWLYWIAHLTGDLHQPLHCASSYALLTHGDAGGNLFKLGLPDEFRPERMMVLHAFWDMGIDHAVQASSVLERRGEDKVAAVTKKWTTDPSLTPSTSEVADTDVLHWIASGAALATNIVYKDIQPGDIPSDAYRDSQILVCKQQAVLAGYRLAYYLNTKLGK